MLNIYLQHWASSDKQTGMILFHSSVTVFTSALQNRQRSDLLTLKICQLQLMWREMEMVKQMAIMVLSAFS